MCETREEWLQALVDEFRPWFDAVGAPLPKRLRVSVGFPSKGMRSNSIGECWAPVADAHGLHQIFVHPRLGDPVRVADVLLHELVHAAVGHAAGHGKAFRNVAVPLGLTGKMTATVASAPLALRLYEVCYWDLPSFPHGALVAGGGTVPGVPLPPGVPGGFTSSGRPKQSTRMLKVECGECGYVLRTTAKWLDTVGPPICPCNGERMDAV